MRIARSSLRLVLFFALFGVSSACAVQNSTHHTQPLPAANSACEESWPVRNSAGQKLSNQSISRSVNSDPEQDSYGCPWQFLAISDVPSASPSTALLAEARTVEFVDTQTNDPVLTELQAMGHLGNQIEHAREGVLQILHQNSSCSSWFEEAEPHPSEKFRSLHYALDAKAPASILKTQITGDRWFYLQPYIARVIENASPGSTITINPHGAFFEETAPVLIVPRDGGPGGREVSRLMRVENYVGGTPQAQMTTLLHEFGHTTGQLPVDAGTPGGPELSTENSRTVLRHCRSQIEAEAKSQK